MLANNYYLFLLLLAQKQICLVIVNMLQEFISQHCKHYFFPIISAAVLLNKLFQGLVPRLS